MQVFNDLTRRKEELIPLTPGHIKMYVCGPTVYDFFHLGNARPFIVYDTMRRYLEYRGYQVDYVQNFTDIDDKMIKRAQTEGCTVQDLGDRMIEAYFQDADALNIRRATHYPRATECIPDMVAMIEKLVQKGHAYVTSDAVYFDVKTWPNYGCLCHYHLDEMEENAGGRTESNDEKHSPMDFALWKFRKEGEADFWPSPWGDGRPGWHIECSAMNYKLHGPTIDIHGGGQDLIFPHHENEIAQSEAANGQPFARYWVHNGFINVDRVKMSKSVGNFFTVRELVKHYPYEVLRFFMLQAHYRMPINFSAELLSGAQNGLERIYNCVDKLNFLLAKAPTERVQGEALQALLETCRRDYEKAMDDDMNTADAYAAIFELIRALNALMAENQLSLTEIHESLDLLYTLTEILGLRLRERAAQEVPSEILALVAERVEAKKSKNYARADEIRNELSSRGWKLEDTAEGPKVTKLA